MKLFTIYKIVFDYYGIPLDINHKCRKPEYVKPRQMYFVFAKLYTKKSLAQIGLFVNKEHCTVLHGMKSINNIIDTEKQFKIDYQIINAKIKGNLRIKSVKRRFKLDEILKLIELWKDIEESKKFKAFYDEIKDVFDDIKDI